MVKRLVKYGDGLALVLDKTLLERLGIDAETPLEVSTDGRVLVVAAVRDEARRQRFEQALEKVNRAYAPALERLAK